VFTASSKLQHQPPVALFEKSFTALSIGPCFWQVTPDNLKLFHKFGACFQLCFKLAVSFQHCIPYEIPYIESIWQIWRPLVFCDDILTAGTQPVLCAARRCALGVLKRPAILSAYMYVTLLSSDHVSLNKEVFYRLHRARND